MAGVAVEPLSSGVRAWLGSHAATTGILIGALLIAATYLVAKRVLTDRARPRCAEAARRLLKAIAIARADAELRAAGVILDRSQNGTLRTDWLDRLLERDQSALTGTRDLVARCHAALSLLQHASAAESSGPSVVDAAYESAWTRFRATCADVHEFTRTPVGVGTTWAVLRTAVSLGAA